MPNVYSPTTPEAATLDTLERQVEELLHTVRTTRAPLEQRLWRQAEGARAVKQKLKDFEELHGKKLADEVRAIFALYPTQQ